MNNKGMDRDIALQIASALNTTGGLIETINDHKYVAHVVTQPVNFTGAIGDPVSFTVVANNVKSYQWQYSNYPTAGTWRTSTLEGSDTDTLAFSFTSVRLGYQYRCAITGLDGNVIYSNAVHLIEEESNG